MPGPKALLEENWRYGEGPRVNQPADYISFLKTEARFKNCGLDNLPKHAIILHDAEAREHIVRLGYAVEDFRFIATGTTDPNIMWLIFAKGNEPAFILNRGLPGAGGIATQAAELAALGIQNIVHIGTCGLVGARVKTGDIVISRGSFKDAGATMLSSGRTSHIDPLAHPDHDLTKAIESQLTSSQLAHSSATGYTIPIFYFQPARLIRELITGEAFPNGPQIDYFEMEQAAFFQTSLLMKIRAASMVVGADRYSLTNEGLGHVFEDDVDQDHAKLNMIRAALKVFRAIDEENIQTA